METHHHIPTREMISNAIIDSKSKKGLSRSSILKYITTNYDMEVGHAQNVVRNALKKCVDDGFFTQIKQHFKLTEKPKKKQKITKKKEKTIKMKKEKEPKEKKEKKEKKKKGRTMKSEITEKHEEQAEKIQESKTEDVEQLKEE